MNLFTKSDAVISPCGLYRYSLTRHWDAAKPSMCFLCLNPSVADATTDDPTVRRLAGFADAWNFGGFELVNLFALRATDPRELLAAPDPIGPDNNVHVAVALAFYQLVVAAWGAWGDRFPERVNEVLGLVKYEGGRRRKLACLGETKGGQPVHPLYQPKSAALTTYIGATDE